MHLFQLRGMQEVTKEVAHAWEKITQMQKKSCQIALFSSILLLFFVLIFTQDDYID